MRLKYNSIDATRLACHRLIYLTLMNAMSDLWRAARKRLSMDTAHRGRQPVFNLPDGDTPDATSH